MAVSELDPRRALVLRVKGYIANKEYAKARALLNKLDHPKRDEWLAKLDQVEAREGAAKLPQPWNPNGIMTAAIVITPIIAALILSWNWRRLGRPHWALFSALGQIATILLLIGVIAGSAMLTVVNPAMPRFLGFELTAVALQFTILLVISYDFFLGEMQRTAYETLKSKGQRAMLAHRYRWVRGALIYLGLLAVITGGISALTASRAQSREFRDGVLALTIPQGWEQEDFNEIENCVDQNRVFTCRLMLSRGTFDAYSMFVATINADGNYESPYDFVERIQDVMGDDADYTTLEIGDYTVAGRPAVYVEYDATEGYHTHLVIDAGSQLVYVAIFTLSEELMDAGWGEIDEILQSMRFMDGRGA